MEQKTHALEIQKAKAKSLWISFLKEKNKRISTILLKKHSKTMQEVFKLQKEISNLLYLELNKHD